MLSEYVVAKDLDRNQSHDTTTARNKRKMTRPKRMLPPISASAESNHCPGEQGEDQAGVALEEEQHSVGPWNIGDLIRNVTVLTSVGQPLDLRSSVEPCEAVVGMDAAWLRSTDTNSSSSVEMNEAEEEEGGRNHIELNEDPISTVTEYLCDAVAMDTGSSSGRDVVATETSSGDVMRLGKGYKHMSRQRRIEANARERSRVHTISAAFESLRRAVPSYAYNQRLSKLAILRIASSYIVALARLADLDYSRAQDDMDFGECVDLCTRTIQAEGRAKRRQ